MFGERLYASAQSLGDTTSREEKNKRSKTFLGSCQQQRRKNIISYPKTSGRTCRDVFGM